MSINFNQVTPTSLIYRTFFLISVLLVLQSCASISEAPSTVSDNHTQLLLDTIDWTIRGRLNIRSKTDSQTVSLFWQQSNQAFDINLSGSLGLGTVLIKGNGSSVRLDKSGEETYYANDLEQASMEWLGYPLPAEHLLYWIRGLHTPDFSYSEERNDMNLLATLQQHNWTLEYDRYEPYNNIYLPGRIRMQNSDYRLTFIISSWIMDNE